VFVEEGEDEARETAAPSRGICAASAAERRISSSLSSVARGLREGFMIE
jgi:hypothetical protein